AELDAVVLRALARDVQDRYQTAEEFATDLRRILNNYRFNPDELKELLRGLFRADFAKEMEEVNACRNARSVEELAVVHDDAPEIEIMHTPSGGGASDAGAGSGPTGPVDPAKGGGLWGRIKSKLSPK